MWIGIKFVLVANVSLRSLSIIVILFSFSARAELITFKDWRAAQIADAQLRLKTAQSQLALSKNDASMTGRAKLSGQHLVMPPNSGATGAASRADLESASLALESAQELGINEYFQLYIVPKASTATFYELAHKLTPEETAILLQAYQRALKRQTTQGSERSL